MTTLQELIKHLERAIPLYEEVGEEDGMSGDYESAEQWFDNAKKLELLISKLKEQLITNKIVSTMTLTNWLNEEENVEVKKVILFALEYLRDKDLYTIEKLNENIVYYNKILKNGE
jgi:hypothetical protein